MRVTFGQTVIATALLFALPNFAQASCGTFEVSKGDVKVQSGATKALSPAAVGSKICSGDTVISGADSRAKLKMEDGNELNISPDSKIVLETYQFNAAENKKKVLLNILSGKVRATTKQENMYNDKSKDGQANTFQVRTKSAVAGVRGTDFLTSFDSKTQKSEVITFRGKVDLGQPGPGGSILNAVSVSAGQTAAVLTGQVPEAPHAVPAKDLNRENKDTKADVAPPKVAPAAGGEAKAPPVKEEGDKPAPKTDTPAAGSGTAAAAPIAEPTKEPVKEPAAPRAPANAVAPAPAPAPAPPVAVMPPAPRMELPPPQPVLPIAPVIPALPPQVRDQIQSGPAKVNVIIKLPTGAQ